MPDHDTGPGYPTSHTKLSVILGGHWWDGRDIDELPSEHDGVLMAKKILARHLGIKVQPAVALATQSPLHPAVRCGARGKDETASLRPSQGI